MAEVIMAPNNSNKANDARAEAAKYRAPQNAEEILNRNDTEHRVNPNRRALKVKRKKKNIAQKIFAQFVEEDAVSIKDYIVNDVVVPKIKDLIFDIGNGILGRSLYGSGSKQNAIKRYGTVSYPSPSYTSYSSKYSYGSSANSFTSPEKSGPYRSTRRAVMDDIIFDTRNEAVGALKDLLDIYFNYGNARVCDLYDIIGTTSEYTDEKYGWSKDVNGLESAYVDHVRDGWKIYLPPIRLID